MADILSQEEIDALLGALSSGDLQAYQPDGGSAEAARQIKAYDFYRPSKFSKDQVRTVYMVHETFSRLWGSSLSNELRNFVSLSVTSIDQLTYDEFIQSIPNPTIIATFTLSPLEGQALMEFSPTIGLPIIDRLLGGAGRSQLQARELTEIEEHVIGNLVDEGMVLLKQAWATMLDLRPELQGIESNPLFVHVVPPSDMVLLIALEARIGDFSGMVNVVYPYKLLEPILSLLSVQPPYPAGARGPDSATRESTKRVLEKVELPLRVELGTAACTMRELLGLKVHDLIVLDTKVDEELKVRVGDIVKFRCRPGQSGTHWAAQVTDVIPDNDGQWLDEGQSTERGEAETND